MTVSFSSYYKCQTCGEKIHCDSCAKILKQSLLRNPEIESAEVNIPKKLLELESGFDMEILEEILEDEGIFL